MKKVSCLLSIVFLFVSLFSGFSANTVLADDASGVVLELTFDETGAKASDFYKEHWGEALTATIEPTGGVENSACLKVSGGEWSNTVSQIFGGLVAGEEYTLSFMFKGSFFALQIDGDVKETINGGMNYQAWTAKTYDFVASGNTMQFACQNAGGDQYYDSIKIYKKGAIENPTNPPVVTPDDGTIRIMCVGDSITHGCGANNPARYFTSYRYPLWKKLVLDGVKVDMVGPKSGNFDGNCTFEEVNGMTFPNNHYATFGIKASEVKDQIANDIRGVAFDIAIIQLGTNDRSGNGDDSATIANNLATIIGHLRAENPKVSVLLVGVPDDVPDDLNPAMRAKAEEITTAASKVIYVDRPADWNQIPDSANPDTLDWVHPNEQGNEKLATVIYEALQKIIKSEEPESEEPVTEEPVTEEPVTEAPETEEPVTEETTVVDITFDGPNASASDFFKEYWGPSLTPTLEATGGVDDSAYVKVSGGNWSNTVSQNFGGFVAGEEYTLSFMFKGSFFNLQIDGDIKGEMAGGANYDDWTEMTFDFVATGDTMQFASQNAGGDQCYDSIKVVKKVDAPATEEPADPTEEATPEPTLEPTPVPTEEPTPSGPSEPIVIFEQNFEGCTVGTQSDNGGKIGGFEGWGAALSCVEDNGGKALKVRGWGAAGHSAWGVEALEAGELYKLSFKAKGVFSDVSLNLCGDGLGLTNDDGMPVNDKVGMGAFTADDWVVKEFYFSPRVTGHLLEDQGLMYQILFFADGNRAEGVTVDDIKLEKVDSISTPEPSDAPENINPNILFEQNFEGENVEADGKIGGFEGWGLTISLVDNGDGRALYARGWGYAGLNVWGEEALEAGAIYRLSFKAKGVFEEVGLNFCADGLGLTDDDGRPINEKVAIGAFTADDWVDKEFYFSPKVTGHLVGNPELMCQIFFGPNGNTVVGITIDDIKLEKVDSIPTPTPSPYVEPEGNIVYNGVFEDPDGDGPENETSGWNDWNCGVFENGMFITRAGNGGTMHVSRMGKAGDEGKKFILRAKVQLVAAETNPDFTGLKFKFNVTGKGEDGKVYENEKFVVTLDDSKFPEGVGSWIQIEEEVSFQTADECIWNTGDGNDRTTKFVAEKFTFGFWAHDGQYAIDNISLVPVVETNTVAPTPETFVPATDSPVTEEPVINAQPNKNVVIYTPVSGIQEVPENSFMTNGGFDSYIEHDSDKIFLPWWHQDGLEFTSEDYITMGPNNQSSTLEGYSLKCDMKNLPQNGSAIAGSPFYLEDFLPEYALKFTFYMKCVGESAADELSSISISGVVRDTQRHLDLSFDDSLAVYNHLTPGVLDGWVRVDHYIKRENVVYAGPMEVQISFKKGQDKNADNIYYIDGVSAEIIPLEDVPKVEFEEETQVPTDEPGTEETPVPSDDPLTDAPATEVPTPVPSTDEPASDVPSATPGTETPTVSESPVVSETPIPIDPDPVVKMKLAKPVIKKIKSTAKKTVKITLKKKVKGAKKFAVKVATKKNFKKAKTVKVKAKKVFKVKHSLLKKGKKIYFKVKALKTAKKKASKFSKAKAYKINK